MKDSEFLIRNIEKRDYQSVSNLILENLKEINSKSYPPSVIEFMCKYYGNNNFDSRVNEFKHLFIAENKDVGKEIIGVGGWKYIIGDKKEGYIGCMFIKVKYHGRGVGNEILKYIEIDARSEGINKFNLNSSINAEQFYLKCGYISKSKEFLEGFGEGIKMIKDF